MKILRIFHRNATIYKGLLVLLLDTYDRYLFVGGVFAGGREGQILLGQGGQGPERHSRLPPFFSHHRVFGAACLKFILYVFIGGYNEILRSYTSSRLGKIVVKKKIF